MKIAVIGHLKFPIAKPFAGGLEAFTHGFSEQLMRRGHEVALFASGDSDPSLPVIPVTPQGTIADSKRRFGREDHDWIEAVEDAQYTQLMTHLMESGFDLVHNHSLSPIPFQFASSLPCPMVTTLHVPCLQRMADVLRSRPADDRGCMVNISRANACQWQDVIGPHRVIHNGVDTCFWKKCRSPKQPRAIWFGRILADKGTHIAIQAAHQAGLAIDVVGPVSDDEYFRTEIRPRLGQSDVYHGHQSHDELCDLISRASVAVITPCWDEPFGLVVAEALACGTPVAAFARGALPEIIRPSVGRLAKPGHIGGLAIAIKRAQQLNGDTCRRYAQQRFSLDRMMSDYERLYHELVHRPAPDTIRMPLSTAATGETQIETSSVLMKQAS